MLFCSLLVNYKKGPKSNKIIVKDLSVIFVIKGFSYPFVKYCV